MRVLNYFIQDDSYCSTFVCDLAEGYNINITEYTSPIPVKDLKNPALNEDIAITNKDKDLGNFLISIGNIYQVPSR